MKSTGPDFSWLNHVESHSSRYPLISMALERLQRLERARAMPMIASLVFLLSSLAQRNGGPFATWRFKQHFIRKNGTCLLFFHPLQWLFFVVKTVYPCRSGTLVGQNVSATPPHVGRRIWKMPSCDFCHTVALSGFVQQNPRLYQNFPYSTTVRPNSNKRSSACEWIDFTVVGPHTWG